MIPKLKRTFTSILPVDAGRIGECNGCGACCKLPVRCPFLKTHDDGKETCSIYKVRPPNCRKFPRSQSQLDTVIETCSFSFDEEPSKALNDEISGKTINNR